jgi:hypothetical protein
MCPIGGGLYSVQNKVLPGAYINFVAMGSRAVMGSRGTAAMPVALNWGPDSKIISVDAGDFNKVSQSLFGYGPTAPELLLIREAFKRAKSLKLYRINGAGAGAAKATKLIGGITITAKYNGTRGNDIKVLVQTNVDDSGKKDVITYLGTVEVDRQTVVAAANLVANDYVTFGAGTLATAAATALTGGANGTEDGTAHASFLSKVEVEEFNTIAYPGTDATTKGLYEAFVKRLRDDEGSKVVGVLYQKSSDYEGIINVKNGVILDDGTTVTGDKAVAWVAGASAAAEINQSLTNTAYDGAVDVDVKYTKSQYEAAIKAGEFVFYGEAGKARVLTDINSLVTFTEAKSADYVSNRVIRVLDGWANDVAAIWGKSYMGTVTNNAIGRTLFKGDLVALGNQYQAIGAISDFLADDVEVIQGLGKRDVQVANKLKPNDSMEKLYNLVTVL